jgi:hypothetical protein
MGVGNPQSEVHHPKAWPRFANRLLALTSMVLLFACASILAMPAVAGEGRHPDAVTVFHCAFGDDWDVNYDLWPDRWVRKTGLGYPHYVNIAIRDDVPEVLPPEIRTAFGRSFSFTTVPLEAGSFVLSCGVRASELVGFASTLSGSSVAHRCLQIDLDGAAAAVASPPIRVMSRFSYVFEARLKNSELKHSSVVITLDFCDSSGQVLQTTKSEPVATTNGWQDIQLGPVEPNNPAIDHVVIGMQVGHTNKGDLRGKVALSDVWLGRLPRIDVTTNNPCNVYSDLKGVELQCTLSGIRVQNPEIDFQLLDSTNKELQREHVTLTGQPIVEDLSRGSDPADGAARTPVFEGTIKWQPNIPDFGFYRVVVLMKGSDKAGSHSGERQLRNETVDLAVVPPLDMPRRGEFGWSLPNGDQPLSFQELSRLLPKVGINWVKVPLWFDGRNPRRGDEIIRFVELLGASNIEVVGLIDHPPTPAGTGRARRQTSIADVLTQDPTTWSPSLEPVMTRLSLRVRWWQLGGDSDTSFAGLADLNKRLVELRSVLFRFGQDVRMGMSWDWANANAQAGNVSWDFEQMCLEKEPTAAKFNELLAMPRANSAMRWVVVEPPHMKKDAANNPQMFEAHATEFVHQLIAAKVSGADAIIIAKPFNDDNGLMHSTKGMPAELLLPWRTTAAMLGGAKYLGQMQLPSGSENRVFLRGDGQVVMVAWNPEPTREVLFLGDHAQQIDLLGRSKALAQRGHEQAIEVGPTPTFVLGLHEAVTRWRMNARFEKLHVPSVPSKAHHNSLQFTNFFPQGVGGSVKVVVLEEHTAIGGAGQQAAGAMRLGQDRWMIEPPQATFQLAAGAATKFPFDIKLKEGVLYGAQPVRVDFVVEADEKLEFSVYSGLEVGTEDISLEVKSRLDKDGTLLIEQLMMNKSAQLADFRCTLQPRGRRPQRMQVYRLGKNLDRKVFRVPDGGSLVGEEMVLELEELNGPRVLKYRFVAGRESGNAADANAPSHNGAPSDRKESPTARSDEKQQPVTSETPVVPARS